MAISSQLHTTDGAAELILLSARSVWEPHLIAQVESLPQPLCTMAGYHFGRWDAEGTPVRGVPGKGVRPALVLAAAAACGGSVAQAAPAAAAVELLHNFTLVHDDVMDGDSTRRGRPTVWTVWGVADAILLGDALHAAAIRILVDEMAPGIATAVVAWLETAALELCRGQHEDCLFETVSAVGIEAYIRMAAGKTAALTGSACAVGALCAGADRGLVAQMDAFGRELGLAFQFVDDILGIWGDPEVTGKPVGNDLARRKLSLPVVAALESGTTAAVELEGLYRSQAPLTPADIARAMELIEVAGGRRVARQLAEQRIRAALTALPDLADTADLAVLTHAMTHRNR
ncbi:geranylgeranyl diphosphate synthase IdsB [Nocardia goodfellowii]|uniref:Geranylgeranyl diphosphate synthase type I n=1 Tax=Nocardia goodfellowii TaxID=882446 RepID=A0ABS4QIM6_9NOCA|nr:geranylgeranyl diphosphate synthase IdsB [Nocardia goodfellowii]MBP2191554.1 geranylgeranyl diphosphate synthase type I [Nocardia goodfellowii]